MLFEKLPIKEGLKCKDWQRRVLEYDPLPISALAKFNPYRRYQGISIIDVFPRNGNMCGCGCGVELTGRKKRWASDECQRYAVDVFWILNGTASVIAKYMRIYCGWQCSKCGCGDSGKDHGLYGTISDFQVDHIIPVKLGGGACWLSNYQILCTSCHRPKTNKDFNWKNAAMPTLF